MKRFFRRSFRGRLFLALLAASLVPLLLCSAMLLQIFRLRLTSSAAEEAQQYLKGALHAMDAAFEGFGRAAAALQADPVVAAGLAGGDTQDTDVNNRLFAATEGLREYARFDLYDLSGRWCYSTRSAPQARTLPTDWGVLYAAAHGRGRT